MQSKNLVSVESGLAKIVEVGISYVPEYQPVQNILILLGFRGQEWLEYNAQASDYVWNRECAN
jgi:hypothetical protein